MELNKEELIEEAKRRYPVGTKFKPAHIPNMSIVYTIKGFDINTKLPSYIWNYSIEEKKETEPVLWDSGRWAEIVSTPEVKAEELTSLPEKWCIDLSDREVFNVVKKYFNTCWAFCNQGFATSDGVDRNHWWVSSDKSIHDYYTEITFDQFKKWVLKESDTLKMKDLVVGEIYYGGFSYITKKDGWIFKYKADELKVDSWHFNGGSHSHDFDWVRPATDEEKQWLEACIKAGKFVSFEDSKVMPEGFIPSLTSPPQPSPVKPTTVEKWSVGTYMVFLKDLDSSREIGNIEKITENVNFANCVTLEKTGECALNREKDDEIMWFATLEEAQKHSKFITDTEPVISTPSAPKVNTKKEAEDYVNGLKKSEPIRIEEDYQNLTDLEVGDTVKCISENKSKISKETGSSAGAGWKKDFEFVIGEITSTTEGKIYWPKGRSQGVYSDAVRLVKKRESEWRRKYGHVDITKYIMGTDPVTTVEDYRIPIFEDCGTFPAIEPKYLKVKAPIVL
jgi:hypothetical protein